MKPETQGKLMVAMLVSILAFGFGTGTVLVTGLYQTSNPTTTLNTDKQSDLPAVPSTNQNIITTENTSTPSTSSPSTTSTPYNGQTDGQDNENDNPTSSNNSI